MTRGQSAGANQLLDIFWELQETKRIGEVAAALADDLGEILLRVAVAVHKQLVALAFLDCVQVLALDVLDDGDLDRLLVRQRADDHWHFVQSGELSGPPAPLAGDDLEGLRVHGRRPDHERLHKPALADRAGKLLELCLGKIPPRIEPARFQQSERNIALLGAGNVLERPSDERGQPSAKSCLLPADRHCSLLPVYPPINDHAARIRRSRSITSEASLI